MAYTILCGSISKKKNSTLIPADASLPGEFSVTLKEGCTEANPVFLISTASFPYNYVKWNGAYYWVTEVNYERYGLFRVSCHIDVLATYKAYITASTAFVLYDGTTNTEIPDGRLSVKTTAVTSENAAITAWSKLGTGFSVVINVTGETACTTYALTLANAVDLLNNVKTWRDNLLPESHPSSYPETLEEIFNVYLEFLSDLGENIVEALRQFLSNDNAASCIKSAYIIPISYANIVGEVRSEIHLGGFDVTVTAKEITTLATRDQQTVTIPWPTGISDWRKGAPYTNVYLYIPFIGVSAIPVSEIIDASYLYVYAVIDQRTGEAVFTVTKEAASGTTASKVIAQYTANLSGSFAIGSAQIGTNQMITSVVSGAAAAAGAVLAPSAAVAAAAGAAGIKGIMGGMTPLPTSIGSVGGGTITQLYGYSCRCMVVFHDTTVAPDSVAATIGTPAMAQKALSGLTGFVQCSEAHIAAPAHGDELDELDAYVNGGFFIE